MDIKRLLKGSFHTITCLSILCFFVLLSFLVVSHPLVNSSGAREYSSSLAQITLTDSLCLEIQDGVLVDNFEYYDLIWQYGWNNIFPSHFPLWGINPFHGFYMTFDNGSRVLDVNRFGYFCFIVTGPGFGMSISKDTIYKDTNGEEHFIPADFPVLNFEVRAPFFHFELFDSFRFEVEVTTENNGYAWLFIIPKNKPGYGSPVDALDTVEENVETISNEQANPSIIKIYLGNNYTDGKWHHVEVNLNSAIQKYSALNEGLAEIHSVSIRGDVYRLDDIVFFKASESYPCNNAPHLIHIGPVYCQLYGQQGNDPHGRWIYAEDLDLGLTSECTADDGYLFPHIADDADGDGIPTALHINPDGTIKNQADITESTLAIYPLDPDGKPNLASPQTPADKDLTWILTMGDTLGPVITFDITEEAEINLDGDNTISGDEMNTWPSYLIQRNGVFIENKVETDPDVVQATGTPYVMDLTNPMYALACALRNSGYDIFPNTRKIEPHLGQVFEDMIVTCRVSDGMATDKETFPISVVNYSVTNHPPNIDDVEDQTFEVGKTNYYQIVAYDPDLEDMLSGLYYTATLKGESRYYIFEPVWPPPCIWEPPKNRLPNGLIAFKPLCEDTIDCIVTVRDPRGMIAVCEFTIFCKIIDEYPGNWFNHPPVILGELDSPQSIRAGEMFIASEMDFLDPDGDKMYWSCNVGSVGNNGVYTFQNIYPGDYQVQIIAYDIRGGSATTEFVIHVKPWWSL